MYGDGSYEEVVDILKSKMSRWESFIKEVKETEKDGVKRFSIRFDHEVFGDFNQLYLCNKAAGMMCGVAFTMDNMG